MSPLPKLPKLLDRKLYKTGQTRGADDDEIYQNRVLRSSTALIPLDFWERCRAVPFENGYIVLLSPSQYFGNPNAAADLLEVGLEIGVNALVFYETREQWNTHNPARLNWESAERRTNPLGGQYVARISATTADDAERIVRGFALKAKKGAGIRVYEYAGGDTIEECRNQLEALFWLCRDSGGVAIANGMTSQNVTVRRDAVLQDCRDRGLLDTARLVQARILNAAERTICPLCMEELTAQGFFNRMAQAEGRLVLDLTITQLNLFHIQELRFGVHNHVPYNLGWGHHHCNVVVKDSGILETLQWMRRVVNRNIADGHMPPENNPN